MFIREWIWLMAHLRMPRSEKGQDVVEYALLCSLLTLAALVTVVLVGPYIKNAFQDTINALNSIA